VHYFQPHFNPTDQADDSTTVAASLLNISRDDSFCSEGKSLISKFSELIRSRNKFMIKWEADKIVIFL